MKFPKLKNALLCRILSYVVAIVGFYVPAILLGVFFRHPLAIVISIVVCSSGLIVFLLKNMYSLMYLDELLAILHCYYTSRKSFKCKRNGTDPKKIKRRILKRIKFFGRKKEATYILPAPEIIKYSAKSSWTVYYKGIDRLFLTYHVTHLDNDTLGNVSRSARVNVKQYAGKGKRLLLDPSQKKGKVSVAVAVVIFADKVEEKTRENLYKALSKKIGDGDMESTLICVIDLENATYYFDSVREPNCGFGYPAKNRAYHMIRKYVFGRKIKIRKNEEYVDLPKGLLEYDKNKDTLWSVWRSIKRDEREFTKQQEKIFKSLKDGECLLDDEVFYYKIGERAVDLLIETDEEKKKVVIKSMGMWSYPKSNKISKNDNQVIKEKAKSYFSSKGYAVTFEEI